MVENIMAIGIMVNNMEKDYFLPQMRKYGKKEYGMKEKELDGLRLIKYKELRRLN